MKVCSRLIGTFVVLSFLWGVHTNVQAAQYDTSKLFESSFAYEVNGDLDRAINDTIQILRVDPNNYIALLRSAWLYYSNARYSDAIAYYTKAAKINPGAIEPKIGVTLPQMALGNWEAAATAAKAAISLAPKDYTVRIRLAYISYMRGAYQESAALYASLLRHYPSDMDVKLGLAWAYYKLGNKAQAKKLFDEVLKVRRDNVSAKSGLDALQ